MSQQDSVQSDSAPVKSVSENRAQSPYQPPHQGDSSTSSHSEKYPVLVADDCDCFGFQAEARWAAPDDEPKDYTDAHIREPLSDVISRTSFGMEKSSPHTFASVNLLIDILRKGQHTEADEEEFEKIMSEIPAGDSVACFRRINSRTLLMHAVEHGSRRMMKSILAKGADIAISSAADHGMTALHFAAFHNRLDLVEELLNPEFLGQIDLRQVKDEYGHTCLHTACRYGNLEMAILIIKNDFELLSVHDNDGFLPIDVLSGVDMSKSVSIANWWIDICEDGKSINHFWWIIRGIDPLGYQSSDSDDNIETGEYGDFISMLRNPKQFLSVKQFVLHRLKHEDTEFFEFVIRNGRLKEVVETFPFIVQNVENEFRDTGTGLRQFYDNERLKTVTEIFRDLADDADETVFPNSRYYKRITVQCVITGRHKIAELLIMNAQTDIIQLSLVCSTILYWIEKEKIHSEIEKELNETKLRWHNVARKALQSIFLENPEHIREFLTWQHPLYGKKSIYDLAIEAKCTLVLSLSCCKSLLYLGWMRLFANRNFLLFIAIVFIPILNIVTTLPLWHAARNINHRKRRDKQLPSNAFHKQNIGKLQTEDRSRSSFLDLIVATYSTPCVRLVYTVQMQILFLALLAYLIRVGLQHSFCVTEVLCVLYLLGYTIEEAVQMACGWREGRVRSYLMDPWNQMDIVALLFGWVAFVLHFIVSFDQAIDTYSDAMSTRLYMVRLLYSLTLLVMSLRMLYVYSLNKTLGTKLRIIWRMLIRDLLPFLAILSIFVLSFAVVAFALLFPNNYSTLGADKFTTGQSVLFAYGYAVYGLFGEFQLDKVTGDECKEGADNVQCPHHIGKYIVPFFFFIVYFIITNTLLLNLLIAMFSKTAEMTDETEEMLSISLLEKVKLKIEFSRLSALPAPFNMIILIARAFGFTCCGGSSHYSENTNTSVMDINKTLQWIVRQSVCLRRIRASLIESPQSDIKHQIDKCIRKISKQDEQIKVLMQLLRKEEYNYNYRQAYR